MTTAPACCDFCPVFDQVPATHTYTDAHGHTYHLCQRHYGPIGSWLNKRGEN